MKDSVSAVFVCKTRVYFIKRQNFLPVFSGYHAPPGGKVDLSDSHEVFLNPLWPKLLSPVLLHAMIREVKEELNYDLEMGVKLSEVISVDYIGTAITPDFNPYRFKNYYFKINLKDEIDFKIDENEAAYGEWKSPQEFLLDYSNGKILLVPPLIKLLEVLAVDISHTDPIILNINIDPLLNVPMIESLYGVRQLLPLSHTFPPANRTNSFIIGDNDQRKILIDPSPRDEIELKKFLSTAELIGFDAIFITHHHPDHYQFAREIAIQYKIGIELSEYTLRKIGHDYFSGISITIRKEGDIITRSLGEDVLVYEVPGHDEGQLALAPRNLSWFLVGDLIQTIGTVVIGAPEGDMEKYFSSLNRIIALDPQFIIPSHGIILGGTHKLTETLKHRQLREIQILELLNQNKSEDEILHLIYQGIPEFLLPYAKKTLQAHLKKLRNEGGISEIC